MKEYPDMTADEMIDKAFRPLGGLDKFLEGMREARKNNPRTDIMCRNCGRSVYVGRCCDAPDIVEYEIKKCTTTKTTK